MGSSNKFSCSSLIERSPANSSSGLSSKTSSSSLKSLSMLLWLISLSSATSLETIAGVAFSRRLSNFSTSSSHHFAPRSAEKTESVFPGRGLSKALGRYAFTNRMVIVPSTSASWASKVSIRSSGRWPRRASPVLRKAGLRQDSFEAGQYDTIPMVDR
ncbi:hypothetical protein GGR57DRAFT_186044 [Xylariaceae sp. FL1272]|nr:hypothetical protein GGR57DRAFT_186044 [Xylariaceae sp. FL1272]